MANSKCLGDLSSLSVIIDDDLCAFPRLHHEGLEWTFLLEKREKKNSYVIKLSVKSPSLSPLSPSFSGICKVRKSAPVETLRKKERGDETQFTTKIGGKLVWVPVIISFCKVSFPVTHLMPYYAKTCCSHPLIA
jgi:hypothetical protein